MAARASMAALITETRLLINDPNPGAPTVPIFTDNQIQDHLDETRFDVRYEQLTEGPTIVNLSGNDSSGTADFIWADYYSINQWWEADAVLQDGYFVVLTPLASDYITGHWQFELTPFVNGTVPGQWPPVFITGKSYDLNLAAKNLWTFRAALLTTAYDFTADGSTFHRSQQQAMCLKMADYYGCKARIRNSSAVRNDIVTASHTERTLLPGNNERLTSY